MEEQMKVVQEPKETLINKAATSFENLKDKVQDKTAEMIKKLKETELAEKAEEKLRDLKAGTKEFINKAADKFDAADEKKPLTQEKK